MAMATAEQVKASHILIKHQGSPRKASWKDPDGRIISATTRDAAVNQLLSLREIIVSGEARFQDVAARYSDCSSAKRGGDLGDKCLAWMIQVKHVIYFVLTLFQL
ncbi:peptidyl-prolyl cis-trans isomerase Pin1-like isoform X2 [Zingiber officinale]|uniref:peptidyl-prolyl cis-trans isomerase Pin1-like isoform X2 n=1 Tax=Zingiber officinale TaxID=94328 RepID=UPI001C4C2916|nr:peptidyl-prolyl cis-trans isomerase Pin1-like isoform X2 [Zingiber officinale]